MNLCHSNEHTTCSQYSNTNEQKIEIFKVMKGDTYQLFSEQTQMVFIIEGSFNIFCKKVNNKRVKKGELILVPLHRPCVITALEEVTMMLMKLTPNIVFCEHMSLDMLLGKINGSSKDESIGLLKPHPRIMDFAISLKNYYVNDDINCSYYFDLKIRELFFLIRVYYDKKQVFHFFKPIYSGDYVFSNGIFKNLNKVKTVKELADMLNYSLSGFEKKFKRVFEVSPYQWMQEQRAKKIYYEINCSKKTFTEIAFEYGFSSPAHFNDFCRNYFNDTPGGVRKENRQWMSA